MVLGLADLICGVTQIFSFALHSLVGFLFTSEGHS